MIKNVLVYSATFVLLSLPLSYFMNFDVASAIAFMLIVSVFLVLNRKNISVQKILFPVFYMVLYRTKLGLRFMDRFSERYRELVKFIGLCFIGIGFLGMLFISFFMVTFLFDLFRRPVQASQGVALVLPFTNIPGIGYLSFWHFLIGIFIVVVVHEGAHGIVARAHKQEIKSSGFAFFSIFIPLLPAAFVEPDEKKLIKQDPIIQHSIYAAGPVINLLLALVLLFTLPFVANPYELAPFEDKITKPVGISFGQAVEGYPVSKSGLAPGTLITGIDDMPIREPEDFLQYTYEIDPGDTVRFEVENGTYYSVTTTHFPDNSSGKGYFGITGIVPERRIDERFDWIAGPYYWIKGLIRWVFLFNFFLGLMNLLPIFITDGGRMLYIALQQTMKDKAKAAKINSFIGMLFLFTLLAGLAINYIGGLFGLGG